MLKSETKSSTHVIGGLDELNTNVTDTDNDGDRGTEGVSQNDDLQISEHTLNRTTLEEEEEEEEKEEEEEEKQQQQECESEIASSTRTFVDQASPNGDTPKRKYEKRNTTRNSTQTGKGQKNKTTRALADSKKRKREESSDCETEIEPCTRVLRNRTRSERQQESKRETASPSRGFVPNSQQQESKRETASPSRGFVFNSQNRAPFEITRGIMSISKTRRAANIVIPNGIVTSSGASQNGSLVSGSYYTICTQHRQPHSLVMFQDKDVSVVVNDLLRNNTLSQINPDAYNSRLLYTELTDQLALIEDRHRDVVAKKNILEGQVNMLEMHIENLNQMNRSVE
uniref:Uncharacterized protein n=1 Tax=Penaeus semisulcatus majanivirus TaxID=2984274 RepID=A0A9C7F7T6_9VIRU|nr:MAG: hypothetical protein [Penaeus semisulcatus majanivirus]